MIDIFLRSTTTLKHSPFVSTRTHRNKYVNPLNLKSHCGTNYNTIVAWNLFYRKPKIESEIRPRGSQLNYGHSKTLQETSGAPQWTWKPERWPSAISQWQKQRVLGKEEREREKEKEGKREKGIGWHRFQSSGFITLISVMDK